MVACETFREHAPRKKLTPLWDGRAAASAVPSIGKVTLNHGGWSAQIFTTGTWRLVCWCALKGKPAASWLKAAREPWLRWLQPADAHSPCPDTQGYPPGMIAPTAALLGHRTRSCALCWHSFGAARLKRTAESSRVVLTRRRGSNSWLPKTCSTGRAGGSRPHWWRNFRSSRVPETPVSPMSRAGQPFFYFSGPLFASLLDFAGPFFASKVDK
jgi:hypothetical protein